MGMKLQSESFSSSPFHQCYSLIARGVFNIQLSAWNYLLFLSCY